ncbi:MAG: hypothetical protein N2C14_12055, partial [Planctomycetales bacterium]
RGIIMSSRLTKIDLQRVAAFVMVLASAVVARTSFAEDPSESRPGKKPEITHETLIGRVVWLSDAMKRRFKVETDADAKEATAVLESPDGTLYPILKDVRGRAFWKDPKWRDVDVVLRARRFSGTQVIQVIRTYVVKKGKVHELDYWCDICAIPMYELMDCACCQGPIRIRERPRPELDALLPNNDPQPK